MSKGNPVFFPGLNGLRALAALAVVVSHVTVHLDLFQLNPHLLGTLPNGNPRNLQLADFAVSIFFALSGFLITYLLLVEQRETGIDVKNFYIRRILRIWPLYYTYYLLASIVIVLWQLPDNAELAFFYIFFLPNVPKILQLKSDLLGHYWSLGVEEQFYLVWPWVVLAARKNIGRVCAGAFAVLVAAKLLAHEVFPDTLFETAMYINRFDCMLVGALGAYFYFTKNQGFLQLFTHRVAQVAAWLCLGLAAVNKFHLASILDHEIMSLCTVVIILGQVQAPFKMINLERPVFDFLGKLSYGTYVIHPMVIFTASRLYRCPPAIPLGLQYAWAYGSAIGGTVLLAYLSYMLLEKRFLKLKNRYSSVNTAR